MVTDRRIEGEYTMVQRIGEAVAGGVDMVQLREKDLPGGELLELARAVKTAIAGRALLIINERVDVAAAAGADGVQLGEAALPPVAARQILGAGAIIGRSVHSEDGALQARVDGANFVLVGSMYPTRSHPEAVPAGPGLIRSIAESPGIHTSSFPLIGIGGITAANIGEVIGAGAGGVAVITSILGSPHPRSEAQKLKQAMLDLWEERTALVGGEVEGGLAAR